jgi:hypothetical protein
VVLVGLFSLEVYLILTGKQTFFGMSPFKPTPTPTPKENTWEPYKGQPKPLVMFGKQTYQINGSTKGAPKISEASFDPIDVKKGGTQIITVKVLDEKSEVTGVTVTMWTDNKNTDVQLKLSTGTTKDGSWAGTFKLDDSYDYIYHATINARNADNKAMSVTVTFK